jgi:hypothetical protein
LIVRLGRQLGPDWSPTGSAGNLAAAFVERPHVFREGNDLMGHGKSSRHWDEGERLLVGGLERGRNGEA